MPKDDEVHDATGTSYDFGARIYDSRVGRFLSIDPLAAKYPNQSPYAGFNDNPLLFADPTGKSGEVTIDKAAKTLTITSHMIFYGSEASPSLAKQTASDVENKWNESCHTVIIDGESYQVQFKITGEYRQCLTPDEIAQNTDIKNNYIRVETSNFRGISFMDAAGSNTGHFMTGNIRADGSSTEGHEMGHGYGLDHPADTDLRGEGQPGIMYPRGTATDAEYTYNPALGSTTVDPITGARANTMNTDKRKVLQSDVDDLGLDRLKFDEQGKAKLGALTNKYKNADGSD
jgi:RHS repeat-associated protein